MSFYLRRNKDWLIDWLVVFKQLWLMHFDPCRFIQWFAPLVVRFFRQWGWLVMHDLIKHDALLWLVGFQQLWLVHFDPCCFIQWFAPLAVCRCMALLLLYFLIVGIHASRISIPLSLLTLSGWSLLIVDAHNQKTQQQESHATADRQGSKSLNETARIKMHQSELLKTN